MPKIPLYRHEPTPTQPGQPRANPGMFSAEAAATSRLGAAIAGIGDVMAAQAIRIQEAQAFKSTATLDTAMDEAWAAYQNGLNPSTDESKWVEGWQKTLDGVVAKVTPKEGGPELKQALELRAKSFRVRTSGDIGQQAKAIGVEKATAAGLTRVDQLWRNGDAAGAEANLNEMARLGLIIPEKVTGMVEKGYSRMQQQQATNLIATDPIGATEALGEKTEGGRWKNFTKLDEDDRLTLLNHARTQTTALQASNYQELIDDMSNQRARTPAQLQELVDRKLITPKQRKTYETAYLHGGYNTAPDAIGQLFTDIAGYDPQKDPGQTERAKLLGRIATTGFPQNVQSQANELLGKKADPNHLLNTAVAKDAFEAIDQRFKLGIFGKYERRTMIMTGPMAGQWTTEVDPKVYEQAMITKRRVEDATRQFIEANPKATAEQVNQFVASVQVGETVKAGRGAILSTLGVQADTPDDDARARRARLDAILNKK